MSKGGEPGVIDVDDVVFDLVGPFLQYVCREHADLVEGCKRIYGKIPSRDIFNNYGLRHLTGCTPERERDAVLSFYQTPEFRNLPVLDGAADELKLLVSAGKEIIVATSRPSYLESITAEQFQRIGVPIAEYNFCNGQVVSNTLNTKGNVCSRVKASFFVEDGIAHVLSCLESSKTTSAFLLDSPWNQGTIPAQASRVPNWKHITEAVLRA